MMNKKGQGVFVGIMVFVVLFIAVIQLIPLLKDIISTARAPGALDCDNASISVPQRGTCVLVDFTLFYFVGVALAVAFGAIGVYGYKKINGQ